MRRRLLFADAIVQTSECVQQGDGVGGGAFLTTSLAPVSEQYHQACLQVLGKVMFIHFRDTLLRN